MECGSSFCNWHIAEPVVKMGQNMPEENTGLLRILKSEQALKKGLFSSISDNFFSVAAFPVPGVYPRWLMASSCFLPMAKS